MKRFLLISTIVLHLLHLSSSSGRVESRARIIANRVLDTVPLIDGHNDLPWSIFSLTQNQLNQTDFRQNLTTDPLWGTANCSSCHTDIPRLLAGKVGAQFWAAFVGCGNQYEDGVERTLEQIDVIHRFVDKYSDVFQFATSADDIENAFANKKIASLIGVEGGHLIDSRLAVLRMFYDLGVRYLSLTHVCPNPWCMNSEKDDEPIPDTIGLTNFGEIVVKEANRLGMLIDLSHTSFQAQKEAMNYSIAPVIYSHSSAYAVCPHYRNVQDEALNLVRANGGIVMINFYTNYISCQSNATLQDVIDHLNHIRNVAGVDHVGLGSDFNGVNRVPTGLDDVSKYVNLFEALAADTVQPWTELELQKLAGLNLLRVLRAVEAVRDSLINQPPFEDLIPITDLGNNTYCMNINNKKDLNDDC